MTKELFRKEALKTPAGDRWGRPVALLPPSWSRITLLLTAGVVAGAAFITTASFPRKETVKGYLRPDRSEAQLFAPEPGTIVDIKAVLGGPVSSGQVLIEVSTSRQIDGASNLQSETLLSLTREREALEIRRELIPRTAAIERERRSIELRATQAEHESLAVTRDLALQRVKLAEERLSRAQRLEAEGAASKAETRQFEDMLIVQRQQINDLNSRIATMAERGEALMVDDKHIAQNAMRELTEVDQRLSQIHAQETQTRASAGYVVRSPLAGRVGTLQAAVGQRADPSRPLLTILPEHAQLTADVFVPSRAIAFIQPGKPVRIQYDAFPYAKFGAASGTVKSVSATTLAPSELRSPQEFKQPVYRVSVDLDQQSMNAYGNEMPLQSGMELSADIVLEERSILEWLLEPFFAASRRMSSA